MSDPDLLGFGERLRILRTEAGLSVRELADRADISPSYLRVLESGENSKTGKPSQPASQHVERLARVLNGSVGELLTLAGQEPSDGSPAATEIRRPRPASNVDALLKDLRAATKSLTRRSAFMYERAVDRLEQFDGEFRELAGGTLRCEPGDEPVVTRLAVLSCRSHLRAVSYQDGTWWGSRLGELYRETHEKLRRDHPDVDITRIFLIDLPEEKATLRSTFQWHLDLEIHTYVLDLGQVTARHREDFILCDETLLRTAGAEPEERKRFEFTDDHNRIRAKLVDFDALRRLAATAGGQLTSLEDLDRTGR